MYVDYNEDAIERLLETSEQMIDKATICVKKGNENMNEILKFYSDKHYDEIIRKYKDLIKKEYNELEIVKEYKELISEFEINLELLFNREENINNNIFDSICTDNVYKYNLDEDKLKSEIATKYSKDKENELKDLSELISEVNAQLSLSDDLDYKLDVLKRYNIIDKKTGKIN